MRFSIITVCLNSSKTIKQTIDSVLNQTLSDFEYIIIDGGSTDNTMEIVASYKNDFSSKGIPFRIFQGKDKGIYDAMNKGISYSHGDFINFINSDDWFEKDCLELVNKEIGVSGSLFVYGDIFLIKKNNKRILKKAKIMNKYFSSRHWSHPSSFVAKRLYDLYGSYACNSIYDDWDFALKLFTHKTKTSVINKPLANFTMNGISHSHGFANAFRRGKIKYEIYRNNGLGRKYFLESFLLEIIKSLIY